MTVQSRFSILSILACSICGLPCAGDDTKAEDDVFANPPRVSRVDGKIEIAFTLMKSTDVEIAILDAKDNVVRHLAAGVLGGRHAPPAPLEAGLAQRVIWDGNNDTGKPAVGGPFNVRVRAGTSVKFGRTIGGSPTTGSVVSMPYRAPVNGLAVDAEGNLYVKMMSTVGSHGNSGMWPWHVRKFDRDGNYVQSILPYPPSTAADNATGVELLSPPGGGFTPANQNSLYPIFAVFGNEIVSRLSGGRMVFVHSERRELNFFSLDGSNAVQTITMWPDDAKLNCPRWLDIQTALSPDGRYAYYSNVAGTAYDGKTPADIDAAWPQGRIYRQDLSKPDSTPERFFDLALPNFEQQPYWMPSAWDKKTAAAGIDTDDAGNVLVCDLVSGQIVEVDSQGKQLSATAVDWPDKVLVGRKNGALYVISRKVSRGELPDATLIKIEGRGDRAKVVAMLPLESSLGGAYTLDESGEVPLLWLAGDRNLLRVEDRGDELVVTRDDVINGDRQAITFVGYMDVDREAELVYVTGNKGNIWRYHGETGDGGLLEIEAVDLAIGPEGRIYTWGVSSHFQGPIARYSRDLKPLPLPSGDATYGFLYGRAGRGTSVCGIDVDARGRVFATYGSNDCHVRAYGEDGELVQFDRTIQLDGRRGPEQVPVAVSGVVGYGGSLRLDGAGNIYLLQHGLPEDHRPPPGFENDEAYRMAVGTIYKFGPGGGELTQTNSSVKDAAGVLARYAGCGPVSRWRAVGACACTKPRFDVDEFGRLYIPNGITFTVSVRDNADNEIARFGGYGNYDCQGPDSAQPRPAIPLGWPVTAGASDGHIYVGDCLNHRIVRIDKHYAAEHKLKIE
jgi:hypothetical protein